MKKSIKTISFVFFALALLLASPFIAGCKQKQRLEQPSFVNFQVNEDVGKQYLITDQNVVAKGYKFFVSNYYDGKDTSQFIEFDTNKNYLDVTNIFKNAQQYFFYVIAIGDENILSSKPSEVFSYTIKYKLDQPSINLIGTTLSWSNVKNADKYLIYANDVLKTEVDGTSFDISSLVTENVPYRFKVACKANGNYLRSSDSATVEYTDHLKLESPTNLVLSSTEQTKILSWKAVANCNKYQVTINKSITVDVEGRNTLDVTSYFTSLGEYTFSVKAIGEDYFISSAQSGAISYTYTKKLDTPTAVRCVVNGNSVEVSWQIVEFAQEYALKINSKEFILNDETGVNSPIATNSIILTFDDLQVSDKSELENISIQVMAKGYNYYLDSDWSIQKVVVEKSKILLPPQILDNIEDGRLEWKDIAGSVGYEIYIEGPNGLRVAKDVAGGDTRYFYYSAYLMSVGQYEFSVVAVAENINNNSVSSNTIKKIQYGKLDVPVIKSVKKVNDTFQIEIEKGKYAQDYSLFVGNNLICENLTEENNTISIDDVRNFVQAGKYSFVVSANENGFYKKSENSLPFEIDVQLAKPSISVVGKNLTWQPIEYADSYEVALDDTIISTQQNVIELENYVPSNEARQIKVLAKGNGFLESAFCDDIIFNNVALQRDGYTTDYFYYGKTYDYEMTSQDELNKLCQYMVYNFLEMGNVYINFDDQTTIRDKVGIALNNLHGTFDFKYLITNKSNKTGESKFTFTYTRISSAPNYTVDTPQKEGLIAYKTSTPRSADYDDFAPEKYIVSQDVWTTDGLMSAVENKAKPKFASSAVVAKQIYAKAKSILRDICSDDMTDYQKCLAIHDYLVNNITYDTVGLSMQTSAVGYFHFIESALLYNLGVCDAYAKSYTLLCGMEGIQALFISGATDKLSPDDTGHAWNKVYIDFDFDGTKEWLTVDCTFDDVGTILNGVKYEVMSHEYFMIPDSYLSARMENSESPTSTVDNANYYDMTKYGNLSGRVENLIQFETIVNKIKTGEIEFAELIVDKNVSIYSLGVSSISFTYDFNKDYKLVFLYN
ncbi:MAG TPA: hypothetical protein DCZ34_03505 [Clostridiales bacterium]|nr:hypothetical protein [Clostridiales bacterium]